MFPKTRKKGSADASADGGLASEGDARFHGYAPAEEAPDAADRLLQQGREATAEGRLRDEL